MIDNLRSVRSFLAVARTRNFTRAAAELRISQSALTVQIQQLEIEIGAVVFNRGKREISLTEAGKVVLGPLERLLIDAEHILSKTRDLAGLRGGVVSLAAIPSVSSWLLPLAVKRYTDLYPGVVIQIHDLIGKKVIEAVKGQEVDFGIGRPARPDKELKCTKLLVDRLCAFVPEGHAFAARKSVTLRELVAMPLIGGEHEATGQNVLEEALRRESLSAHFLYDTNYPPTALGFVEAGLGIAILPMLSVGRLFSARIKCVSITSPRLIRRIDVIERRDRSPSPAAGKMLEIIRQVRSTSTPRKNRRTVVKTESA